MEGRLIVFVFGKGGIGKIIIVVNLGVVLV